MEGFAEYIRKLRMDRELSLRDVAAGTGISVSYLTQIEHGRRGVPKNAILKKLAFLYRVPLEDLLKSAGYLDEATPVVTDEEELNRAFEFAMTDPQFKFGTRITGPVDNNMKRFTVELYEAATGKKLLTGD